MLATKRNTNGVKSIARALRGSSAVALKRRKLHRLSGTFDIMTSPFLHPIPGAVSPHCFQLSGMGKTTSPLPSSSSFHSFPWPFVPIAILPWSNSIASKLPIVFTPFTATDVCLHRSFSFSIVKKIIPGEHTAVLPWHFHSDILGQTSIHCKFLLRAVPFFLSSFIFGPFAPTTIHLHSIHS